MNSLPSRRRLAPIARQAMLDRGLEPDFPPAALAEVAAMQRASPQDGEVRDLRNLPWCSIDNDDSLDLDQLSVTGHSRSGAPALLVAVADVDSRVKKGSAIDAHACANTTSVYTAAGIFPMLPEKLSTDLTSLNEREERLAVVTEITVEEDGAVNAFEVYRARVRNRAKLAYNAVAAWLEGRAPVPERLAAVPGLEDQVHAQDRAAQAMKRRRHEQGALSLRTPEARPVFRGDTVADLETEVPNRARELIEELMIAANGANARFLQGRGFPSLRRVLRSPQRWQRIAALAAGLGERLPGEPDAAALERFLCRQRDSDPEGYPDLSLAVVKLLGRGEYAVEQPDTSPAGHFGLAASDYTHSTAPNRRFPDLVTQRLIKAALAGTDSPYGDEELGALARRCTEQEDNAAKVERRVRKSAAALLLASRIGERFDAIVTGAAEKGTWVRIRHPAAEGRLVRGTEGLDVGDHAVVRLVHTDVERGYVDFERGRAP